MSVVTVGLPVGKPANYTYQNTVLGYPFVPGNVARNGVATARPVEEEPSTPHFGPRSAHLAADATRSFTGRLEARESHVDVLPAGRLVAVDGQHIARWLQRLQG